MKNPAPSSLPVFSAALARLAGLACLLALLPAPAFAAHTPSTWNGSASTDFMTPANWSADIPMSNKYGVFADPAAVSNQPNHTAARTLGGLRFDAPAGGWTIAGTGTLMIAGNNTNPEIYGINALAQTSGINTINAVIATATNSAVVMQNWSVGTGGTLALTNRIYGGGVGSIWQIGTAGTGEGTLVLNLANANGRTGPAHLRAGVILFNISAPLGPAAAPVTVVGAADGGAGVTLATTAAGTVTLSNSSLTIGDDVTLTLAGTGAMTFSGTFFGAGGIEIQNPSLTTFSVSGTSPYDGPVRIVRGRAHLGAGASLGVNNAALWTIESAGTLSFNNSSRNRRGDTVNHGVILMSRTDGSTGNGQVFNTGKTVSGTGAFWTASPALAATGTADFTFAGTVAPGAAPGAAGKFTFGDGALAAVAQFQNTSVTVWDLTGTGGVAGTDFDAFDLPGGSSAILRAGAKLTVSIGPGAGIAWDDSDPYWREGHTYALFSTAAVTGTFTLQNHTYSGATGNGAFTTDGQNLIYAFTPASGPGVAITTQPTGTTIAEGGAASLAIVATGTSALTYAWSKNGAPLADDSHTSDAATATLALTAVPLSAGGTYTVTASNARDSATSAAAVLTVTPAAAPPAGAPVAGAATGVTQTGFTANWSAVAGATGYRLDVSTSPAFAAGSFVNGSENYENLDVGNVLSYAVTGLAADTPYYYRVRACNSAGAGANSDIGNPVTPPVPEPNFHTWNGSAGTGFLTDANWTPAAVPVSTGVAVFADPAAAPAQPDLSGAARTINGLRFTGGTGGWTLAGTGTLALAGDASLPEIYGINALAQTAGLTTINTAVRIGANASATTQNWSVGTGGTLALNGNLYGDSTSVLQIGTPGAGEGALLINGTHSRTGSTQLRAGTVLVGVNNALGNAATPVLVLAAADGGAGATLAPATSATRSLAHPVTLGEGVALTIGAAADGSGTGAVLLSGTLAGPGSLIVEGAAILTNGGNTYKGATIIRPGAVLQVGNAATSGALTVSSSADPAAGVVLEAGGTLALNRTGGDYTIDFNWNPVTGAGEIVKYQPNRVQFNGQATSTFTGNLRVVQGRAHLGGAYAIGNTNNTGAWTIEAGGTLSYQSQGVNRRGDTVNNGAIVLWNTAGSTGNGVNFLAGKAVTGTGAFWAEAVKTAAGTADFTFGGTVAPGAEPGAAGALTLGKDTVPVVAQFLATSRIVWELAGTGGVPGVDYDSISLRGGSTVNLLPGAGVQINLGPGMAWDETNPYWLASHTYALFDPLEPGGDAVAGAPAISGGTFRGTRGKGVFSADGPNLVYTYTIDGPPEFVLEPDNMTVPEGETATFTALAIGSAPPDYVWRKDGAPLLDGGRVSGAGGPALAIAAVAPSDAGGYSVLAVTPSGEVVSRAATLTVIPAAAAPTAAPGVAAGAGNITATGFVANWGDVAGATGYQLDVSTSATFAPGAFVAGYENLDVGNVLSYAVTGLDAGAQYYYRVRACNSAGAGADSAAVALTTADGAPVITSAAGAVFAEGVESTFAVRADGVPPFAFSAGSALPVWLALGAADGVLRGTPPAGAAAASPYSFTLVVSNTHAPEAAQTFTLAVAPPPPVVEPLTVTTLAGLAGATGTTNAAGPAARFHSPLGLALDAAGNIFLADADNHLIRKITPAGVVSTLAGTGAAGAANGPASAATFNMPTDIAADAAGNLYVADTLNHVIRKIAAGGEVTTLAGRPGSAGADDGWDAAPRFNAPQGLALDPARGLLYVADTGNHAIRKITLSHGGVTTLAGAPGAAGDTDGAAAAARFNAPTGITLDAKGVKIYVADTDNHTLRVVTAATGEVGTLAGLAGAAGAVDGAPADARFNLPTALALDAAGKKLRVLDTASHTVREIALGIGAVGAIGGLAGVAGSDDGVGDAARFNAPSGLAAGTDGTLFIADTGNHTLRAGRPAQPVAIITQPRGLTVQPGDPVEFTVTATGWPQPLAYQWYRNGDLIPDATGDTLKLGPAQEAGDGDTYTVVVTNPLGSVTSIGACLTVAKRIHPPSSSSAGGGGAPGIPLLLALALLLALKPPPSRRSRRRFS